jgi:prepilin-type N-terminal cleavage/methylation domain-containing protein
MRRVTSHMQRRREARGFTLVEMLVVVAITAIVAGSLILANSSSAEKRPTTRRIVESSLNQAVSLASSTGNGATVLFIPQTNQVEIQVYAGRPNGQTPDASTATLVHTSSAPLGVSATGQNINVSSTGPSFAVFVDNFGHASYGTWAGPGSGNVSPTCNVTQTPLKISVLWDPNSTAPTESLQMPCGGSKFTAYDANGNIIPDLPTGT